ncbi:hypothetical protein ILUMI_13798 [Ignelater luminosus]|uniref:Uncharacterized protein n=1 Tax=Ignelater luminosus TaxID=2038154 RepID=A0A8K0CW34_IGNLU|nr:hypothetical protein ILUMI_13798 [Ignelater luminosus]
MAPIVPPQRFTTEAYDRKDEKDCSKSLHHQQTIVAMNGLKRVQQMANEHAERVTVVDCVNAVGAAIPPIILFKGQRLKLEFNDNLPARSLVKMTPKGYMSDESPPHEEALNCRGEEVTKDLTQTKHPQFPLVLQLPCHLQQ